MLIKEALRSVQKEFEDLSKKKKKELEVYLEFLGYFVELLVFVLEVYEKSCN